jgi:hypothetical protein
MTPKAVRSPAVRIDDMLEAVAGIRETIAGDPIKEVMADRTRQRAIERGFEDHI